MRGFALSEKMNGLKLGMSPATIEYAKPHVPSEIQADTLFTFMRQLDFLLPIIRTAMISPRYCEEDISYLGIEGFKRMAYPIRIIRLHLFRVQFTCIRLPFQVPSLLPLGMGNMSALCGLEEFPTRVSALLLLSQKKRAFCIQATMLMKKGIT